MCMNQRARKWAKGLSGAFRTPASHKWSQDTVRDMASEFFLFLGSLQVWLSSPWFSNMFSSEQGAGLEKIHNVGLINSKTPSQRGSFQGQQVTVTLSLSTEGVNVRETTAQANRPTSGCFPGRLKAFHLYSCSDPLSPEPRDTPHMPAEQKLAETSTFALFSCRSREVHIRALELNS